VHEKKKLPLYHLLPSHWAPVPLIIVNVSKTTSANLLNRELNDIIKV